MVGATSTRLKFWTRLSLSPMIAAMRRAAIVFLAICALSLQACGERAPEGATLVRATRLYVAPDAPAIDDAAVLIVEGRIAAAGPASEIPAGGAASLGQCDGGTLVAGFQNSHVHFTDAKFAGAKDRPAAELTTAMTEMLNRYGFTTVVDTASDLANTVALRARVEGGEVPGPRILTAGGALYPKAGIPIYLRDLPPELLASLAQPASVEEALASVQANLDGGADATKLFLMTPQDGGRYAFMQPDIALAASDETHRRGLPVLAHPTDIEGINLAIEAGVDVLVHTTIGEGKTVWEPALIEQLIAKNMALDTDAAALSLRAEAREARTAHRRSCDGRCRGTGSRVLESGWPGPIRHRRRLHDGLRPHRGIPAHGACADANADPRLADDGASRTMERGEAARAHREGNGRRSRRSRRRSGRGSGEFREGPMHDPGRAAHLYGGLRRIADRSAANPGLANLRCSWYLL